MVQKSPRGELCRNPLREVAFRKNTGYSNPSGHLLACFENKDELLNEVRMLILNKLMCPTILPTSKERAIFSYLELIVVRNLLVYTVEDQIVRKFSKNEERFSRKLFSNNPSFTSQAS